MLIGCRSLRRPRSQSQCSANHYDNHRHSESGFCVSVVCCRFSDSQILFVWVCECSLPSVVINFSVTPFSHIVPKQLTSGAKNPMNSQLRDTNWDKGLSQSVSRRLSFGDTAVPQPTNHLFIGQQLQKSIINQVLSSEYKLQK